MDQTARRGEFLISTDKNLLDVPFITGFLSGSYWAKNIPAETVLKAISGSVCFGIYKKNVQIGFARVVTDEATFAYLADVFITQENRGQGLSKWLMEIILAHPGLQGLRRFLLATRDAQGLYAQFGFTPITNPDRWMQIHNPDVYKFK